MLDATASLLAWKLTWNVLLLPPLTMPSEQLTVRLMLSFLLLVAGVKVAVTPSND